MRPRLNLDPALIKRIARGNPENLPSFMVHDDGTVPWGWVQVDSKQRIHLRRSDFFSVVTPQIPVNEGVWLTRNIQHFTVDLSAAQLDGGSGKHGKMTQAEYRKITRNDDRCPECGSAVEALHYTPGARACVNAFCNYGTVSEDAPRKLQEAAGLLRAGG